MKRKILIISLVLILTGTVAMASGVIKFTPDEAYQAARDNNLQGEIDELNHELKQMSYDKSVSESKYATINTYQGQIKKYVTPFDAETSLKVSEMELARSDRQLEVTVLKEAVALEEGTLAYNDASDAYDDALAAYNSAKDDSATTESELLSLQYTAENSRIKMVQAKNNMDRIQDELDSLLGTENASVEIPKEYKTPYGISADDVFRSMLETDISLYQAKRSYESAQMRFNIAKDLFQENDETYISSLSSLKSAELSYNKKTSSLEVSAYDKVDNLKNLYDSIELAKLNLQIKKGLYDAALKQYDAGVVSVKSLGDAEYSYELAGRQVDSAIYDYVIAVMQFGIDTGYSF